MFCAAKSCMQDTSAHTMCAVVRIESEGFSVPTTGRFANLHTLFDFKCINEGKPPNMGLWVIGDFDYANA